MSQNIYKIVAREGRLYTVAVNGDVLAVADNPPVDLMISAYKTNSAVKLVGNPASHTGWQLCPLDEYLALAALHTIATVTHPTPHLTLVTANTPLETPTEHEEIRQFIQDSVSLKPKILKIDDLRWKFAVRAVLRGENLMIRGDSGCGKTLLAYVLPEVFRRPFFVFNLGATQDARSSLIGNTHFRKDDGTYVANAFFVNAIQTPNAVVLLDEVSRAHPDAHNILMSVLDQKQRYLRIDERPDTPTITVAPGVTFLSTANVGTEYTATRTMDRAFLDRWTTLMMEPLELAVEIELLTELFPELDPLDITAIAEIATDTRLQVRSMNPHVSTAISTRITTEMAALMYDGFSLAEAAEVKIYPFFPDAGGDTSERTYMKQLVQLHIRPSATATTPPAPFGLAPTPPLPVIPHNTAPMPFGNKGKGKKGP